MVVAVLAGWLLASCSGESATADINWDTYERATLPMWTGGQGSAEEEPLGELEVAADVLGADIDLELAADVELYIDASAGSDGNSGREPSEPKATFSAALDTAAQLRAEGMSVRIVVRPGVYRESIGIGPDDGDAPPLVIAAEEPGTAIVSGADLWEQWAWDPDAEAFAHEWAVELPPAAPDVPEIVGRREMISVEGRPLLQVLDEGELSAGSFYVDSGEDRVFMLPPDGSSFAGFAAEVAVRPMLLELDGVRNVAVVGLAFQSAANSLSETAVQIVNSENVLFHDNEVARNNWTGLGLATSSSITLSDNTINRNGGGGANFYESTDVVFAGNDTSFNNWRGARGDYTGWSIAGVKAVAVRRIQISGHRAWGNLTRGLWLDYDVSDVAIVGSTWRDNLTDGLFLEAVPGPVAVRDSESLDNGRHGLMIVNVYGARIEGSLVCGNGVDQLHFNAERGGREVERDDGTLSMMALQELMLESNTVAGAGPLVRFSIPGGDFDAMLPSMESDRNTWVSLDESGEGFVTPGGSGDLAWWQSTTGADVESIERVMPAGVDCGELGR